MAIFEYMFGPRLYMDYDYFDGRNIATSIYKLPRLERWGEYIVSSSTFLFQISVYVTPLMATVVYKRSENISDSMVNYIKFSATVLFMASIGFGLRAYGRLCSEPYRRLVQALKMAKSKNTAAQGREALSSFDFDFQRWPADFDVRKIESWELGEPANKVLDPIVQKFHIIKAPQYLIGYMLMHSLGIRAIYPGSVKAIQCYLRSNLIKGRAKQILKGGAKRFKLIAVDGNQIDTVFIDNRNKSQSGQVLIISSEGNLSFYEVGVGTTPVGRVFSVLGWNHPGFEGSTGKPYPKQEMNAVDAVITFAIRELHFELCDIILYGWSIGGFSTVCAASKYNGLKGIILDGTFDDIVELAVLRVPSLFSRLVELSVRGHCNLNNAEMLKKYHGPVVIIRRVFDETIASDSRIETNRGNFLAIKLLKYRYPNIFGANQIALVQKILSQPLHNDIYTKSIEKEVTKQLVKHACKYGKRFPMLIGINFNESQRNSMAKFLLAKYVRDFHSSHCTRLPLEFFQSPWDIPEI